MNLKNKKLLVQTKTGKTFDVINPATGKSIAKVAEQGVKDINAAIAKAEKALPAWSAKLAKERAKILRNWADLMMQNQDDLAAIMTLEQGKPLKESKGEIAYAASFFEWFGEESKRIYGETIPSPFENSRIVTIKQPVGICVTITPWNFPAAMIARKVAAALAAGCTVVSKPASETPLSAMALALLGKEAGVPDGVFNLITTSDSKTFGKIVCEDERIKKLSFTGSTEVGKILMAQSAGSLKKLSMELGGNAPFIVFEDADIDAAVEGAIICKFRNAGQTCVCANRIYVHEKIYDEFEKKLTARVKQMKIGDGMEKGIEIGPLINDKAVKKVETFMQDALKKGAKIKTGGKKKKGLFFEPTVLTNVSDKMSMACEEIFGPVAPLYKFKTEDEVIKRANDTPYGLAAYFYSRDMARIWRVSESLQYGMVAVNAGILSTEVAPFGGIKESGFGREGSKYGLEDYLNIKYMLMAGIAE